MKKIASSLILFFLSHLSGAQQNTILIIADDVSTDYFGFYEDAKDTANVPNIRTLLSNGVRFTKAWATPVCSPTRSGILTGRYPFRTGIGTVVTNNQSAQLDTAEMSLAKLLKSYAPVKYNTANVGKWHLHVMMPQKYLYPNLLGYNFYAGNFNGALNDYYHYARISNGVLDTVTTYATTETVNDAIGWMDTMNAAKPFFLWLAFNAPHTPYHKPPNNLISNTGLSGTTADINANPKEYFKASMEAMDAEIGRLFQYLLTHNLMDSTNVIFIGDNGNAIRVAQIADTNRAKGTLYEYGVHVPFIISGPAVVSPGRVSNALVSTPDLFATILEMSGFSNWLNYIPPNKLPVDSKSILQILRNQSVSVRDWNFTEQFAQPTVANDGKTIRNLNYHLIRFDNGIEEMYNQSTDTLEQNDLLAGTLTAVDSSNYRSLCDTLSALVGTGTCSAVLGIHGINETPGSLIHVANPFSDKIIISVDENLEGVSLSLLDVTGRIVASWPESNLFKGRSDELRLNGVALQGIYLLDVRCSGINFRMKLVHQ